MRIFGCRPCDTTVALTVAPPITGVPTFSSAPLPTSQHLVEHDLLPDVGRDLLHLDFFTDGNLVLFATGSNDRVHLFAPRLQPAPPTEAKRSREV